MSYISDNRLAFENDFFCHKGDKTLQFFAVPFHISKTEDHREYPSPNLPKYYPSHLDKK
jgi:hypothetical protein